MPDKREMQLVAPPILGGALYVLYLVWSLATGNLNRYTAKALLAAAGLAIYAGYIILWQNEIKDLWHSSPLVVVFGLLLSLLAPFGLFYWIWRVQVGAKAEIFSLGSKRRSELLDAESNFARQVRFAVLIWGGANSLGLLFAIFHSVIRKH
jgi:hypothetical protein